MQIVLLLLFFLLLFNSELQTLRTNLDASVKLLQKTCMKNMYEIIKTRSDFNTLLDLKSRLLHNTTLTLLNFRKCYF